ncbi:MAG: acyltransferase [Bacteroidetes bacterium]|nr:acyltransferase [Bacteroidota bacterium]
MATGKMKYYTELDGIRGFAALTIFFFHFLHGQTFSGLLPNIFMKLVSIGPTMANLFFVLSGFLITQILLDAKGTNNYFSYYYARRILRIFPLYYLALLIYFFGLPILYGRGIPSFSLQWYNWVHLQNLPITFRWPHAGPKYLWSLAVEEHFYLLWPMLVLWLNKRQLISVCIGIICLALAMHMLLAANGYPVFFFTFTTIDALAMGAIAGILHYDGRLTTYRKRVRQWMYISGIPAIILWFVFFGTTSALFNIGMPLLFNLFYASSLSYLVTAHQGHFLKRSLQKKVPVFTGTISYGFFIFHPLCISFTHRIFKNQAMMLQIIIALIASIIVATASYYLFEKKFMRLKRYF